MSLKEEFICFIPDCRNSSSECPEKKFIRVPALPKTRELWIKAGLRLRVKKPIVDNSPLFCCEDHFDLKKDTSNKWTEGAGGLIVKLKRGVLPHVFPKKQTVKVQPKGDSAAEIEEMEDSKILEEALMKYEEKKRKSTSEKVEEPPAPPQSKKKKVVKEILAWIPSEGSKRSAPGNPNSSILLVQQPSSSSTSSATTSHSIVNSTNGQHSLILLNQNQLISSPVVVQNGQNQHVLLAPPMQKQQRLILPAEQSTRKTGSSNEASSNNIQVHERSQPSSLQVPPLVLQPKKEKYNVLSPGLMMIQSEFKEMKETISSLNNEVSVLKKKVNELKNQKCLMMNEYSASMKSFNLQFEDKVISAMNGFLTPSQVRLILSSKKNGEADDGKRKIFWTKDDVDRAISLRNISPKAYRFLRSELKYPLPAPSSIRQYLLLEKKRKMNSDNKIAKEEPCCTKAKAPESNGTSEKKDVKVVTIPEAKEGQKEANGANIPSDSSQNTIAKSNSKDVGQEKMGVKHTDSAAKGETKGSKSNLNNIKPITIKIKPVVVDDAQKQGSSNGEMPARKEEIENNKVDENP